jgi:hypothetical protein
MKSPKRDCKLSASNIDPEIKAFTRSIEHLGSSIRDMQGLRLLEALKRDKVSEGPYPHVTLFEAANRIMTDLVILYGVRWLLKNNEFPFSCYEVEFGNENKNGFDIQAKENGRSLVGEVFNVAPSFFQGKKSSMLKKLRGKRNEADFTILMFNQDAIGKNYKPKQVEGEYFLFVDVGKGTAEIIPKRSVSNDHTMNPF